jgi:hypothetical protein
MQPNPGFLVQIFPSGNSKLDQIKILEVSWCLSISLAIRQGLKSNSEVVWRVNKAR